MNIINDINRLHYVLDLIDLDDPTGTTLTDAMRVELNNIEGQLPKCCEYLQQDIHPLHGDKTREVVRLSQSITDALKGTTIDTETLTRTTLYLSGEINQVIYNKTKKQVA